MQRQDIRITCEASPSAHCDAEMTLWLQSASGREVELPAATLKQMLPRNWSWAVVVDGRQSPLPASIALSTEAIQVALHAALLLKGKPKKGRGFSYVTGCDGELDDPILVRHALLAEDGTDLSTSIPVFQYGPPNIALAPEDGSVVATQTREGAIDIVRYVASSPLRLGGPYVAIGASFSTAAEGSARLIHRIGYEIARPSWLIHSLSVETDLQNVVVAPAVELALSGAFLYVQPSACAIGIGMPLRMGDEPAVGVRAQLAVQFPILGLVAMLDHYPALNDTDSTSAAILGQISF